MVVYSECDERILFQFLQVHYNPRSNRILSHFWKKKKKLKIQTMDKGYKHIRHQDLQL